jgi:hypothetical protein
VIYWGEEEEKDVRKGKYNILISVEDWEGAGVAADVAAGVERAKKRLGCIIGSKLIQTCLLRMWPQPQAVVGGRIERSSERRGHTWVHANRRKKSMVACLASSCGWSYLFPQLRLHSPGRPIGMLLVRTMWAQEVEDA